VAVLLENRRVFRCRQKASTDGTVGTVSGKLFPLWGAVELKARLANTVLSAGWDSSWRSDDVWVRSLLIARVRHCGSGLMLLGRPSTAWRQQSAGTYRPGSALKPQSPLRPPTAASQSQSPGRVSSTPDSGRPSTSSRPVSITSFGEWMSYAVSLANRPSTCLAVHLPVCLSICSSCVGP